MKQLLFYASLSPQKFEIGVYKNQKIKFCVQAWGNN